MYALYGSIKGSIRTDTHPWYRDTFDVYVRAHRHLRGLMAFGHAMSSLPLVGTLPALALGFITGLRLNQRASAAGHFAFCTSPNERRIVQEFVSATLGADAETASHSRRGQGTFAWVFVSRLPQIHRVLQRVGKRHSLFVALRVAQNIAAYLRFQQTIRARAPRHFLTSSLSGPLVIAGHAVARAHGVRNMILDHGHHFNAFTRLRFTLVICSDPFNQRLLVGSRNVIDRSLTRRPDLVPLDFRAQSEWGLFLPKIYSVHVLAQARRGTANWSVRHHSSDLMTTPVPVPTRSLAEDLRRVALVASGSSTVLIDALWAGTPAVYVREVDVAVQEGHEFVKLGLVFAVETLAQISWSEVVDFYRSAAWREAFQKTYGLGLPDAEFLRSCREVLHA